MDKEIVLFKLINGDEVISECKTEDAFYFLKAPRKIFLAQGAGGTFGVRMMPWIVGNPDGVFPVHSSHVLTVSENATEELKKGYLAETSPLDLSATTSKQLVV